MFLEGGVIAFAGCLPFLDVNAISKLGKYVPIIHLHDPKDVMVYYDHAVRGLEVAEKIGAEGYKEIVPVKAGSENHNGYSESAPAVANEYLSKLLA